MLFYHDSRVYESRHPKVQKLFWYSLKLVPDPPVVVCNRKSESRSQEESRRDSRSESHFQLHSV